MATFGMMSSDLLSSVGSIRLQDLSTRSKSGHLTAAESLALAILRGGREGEEGVPAMVDAAQEEYGHGSYRVPVRVVGNWRKCMFVVTPRTGTTPEDQRYMNSELRSCIDSMISLENQAYVLTIPYGTKLEVYEVAPGEPAGVTVKEAST